ncbi:MAG: hypothetical protein V4537_07905 [Pseudomonadota bacterium]
MTSTMSVAYRTPAPRMMSIFSRNAMGPQYAALRSGTTFASAAWPSANRTFYYPFTLLDYETVYKFWWANGAATGTNNLQMAIYRDTYERLILGTSTLAAGNTQVQEDDITDVGLPPGRYYLGIGCNGTTATVIRGAPSNTSAEASGAYGQATAFTLPDPMVPVRISSLSDSFVLCGVRFR